VPQSSNLFHLFRSQNHVFAYIGMVLGGSLMQSTHGEAGLKRPLGNGMRAIEIERRPRRRGR
jgi:hypothetical protein